MASNELVVITFHGAKNRNKVLKALEDSGIQCLNFLHTLAERKNSESIVFKAPVNDQSLYEKLCNLRKKGVCQISTAEYQLKKKSVWSRWQYGDRPFTLTQKIPEIAVQSIPLVIKIIELLASL